MSLHDGAHLFPYLTCLWFLLVSCHYLSNYAYLLPLSSVRRLSLPGDIFFPVGLLDTMMKK